MIKTYDITSLSCFSVGNFSHSVGHFRAIGVVKGEFDNDDFGSYVSVPAKVNKNLVGYGFIVVDYRGRPEEGLYIETELRVVRCSRVVRVFTNINFNKTSTLPAEIWVHGYNINKKG